MCFISKVSCPVSSAELRLQFPEAQMTDHTHTHTHTHLVQQEVKEK